MRKILSVLLLLTFCNVFVFGKETQKTLIDDLKQFIADDIETTAFALQSVPIVSVSVVQLDRIWPSEGCDVGSSPAGGTKN